MLCKSLKVWVGGVGDETRRTSERQAVGEKGGAALRDLVSWGMHSALSREKWGETIITGRHKEARIKALGKRTPSQQGEERSECERCLV